MNTAKFHIDETRLNAFLNALRDQNDNEGIPSWDEYEGTGLARFSLMLWAFDDSDISEKMTADDDGTVTYKGDEYRGFLPHGTVWAYGDCEPDMMLKDGFHTVLFSKRELLQSFGIDC